MEEVKKATKGAASAQIPKGLPEMILRKTRT
jgi:hypothetical protein